MTIINCSLQIERHLNPHYSIENDYYKPNPSVRHNRCVCMWGGGGGGGGGGRGARGQESGRGGEGVVYLTSRGRPTEIGLQLGNACYPCSR